MSGACAKQVVTATIITPEGQRFVGTNWVERPQSKCPRADMPTGVGYELCASVCAQSGHAEIDALRLARGKTRGATLYLEGHTYACEPCKAACKAAGIHKIIVGAPPK